LEIYRPGKGLKVEFCFQPFFHLEKTL